MSKAPPPKPPRRPRRPARPAPRAPLSGVPRGEVERLVKLRHHDPHGLLGAHPSPEGLVVRAFRPDAAEVTWEAEGLAPLPLTRCHDAGLFEGFLPGQTTFVPYRLTVRNRLGWTFTLHDPYAFPVTLGELDLHLLGEGRDHHIYDHLGAHVREMEGVAGVSFALWAPNAAGVSVVGDFNGWDGRFHAMRCLGAVGVWELFIPGLEAGQRYKYELRTGGGHVLLKADPLATATELPPATASVIHTPAHRFRDGAWLKAQRESDPLRRPMSIYEVHLASWRQAPPDGRLLTYRELAKALGDYVSGMGFTHVELLPVTEHPFGGSWGYQVGSYYAPTARHGSPDDLRHFVDQLHQRGIGVILDWVPAHFPKDEFCLGRFDGTALYEHQDPRLGEHPDWGTYIFNYGRKEVRNFLLGSALYWIERMHMDGLRMDAVASMIYLDYSRREGQWLPNTFGGRENLEAIDFLKELNEVVYGRNPGALMVAEESTAWGGVSRPTYAGGLGFGFKWNMGWMHDTLSYFSKDPVYRRFHHNDLTFAMVYAWSENFILPLSHDEVVHGKRSLLDKMPGDRWQKFANLRALYGLMWAHPGRKLLFMGGEFGQWREWNHHYSLDWHLLDEGDHRGLQQLVRDLNHRYRAEPALWEADSEPAGFQWIDPHASDDNVLAFLRNAPTRGEKLVCVANLSPTVRHGYRIGLPGPGRYAEIINTDAAVYGGSNVGNVGGVVAEPRPWHGLPASAAITLPPLAVLWFKAP